MKEYIISYWYLAINYSFRAQASRLLVMSLLNEFFIPIYVTLSDVLCYHVCRCLLIDGNINPNSNGEGHE